MATDEELRVAAEALEESVLVAGLDSAGETAAARVAAGDLPATDDAPNPAAVVLAVDGSRSSPGDDAPDEPRLQAPESVPTVDPPLGVAVVSLPSTAGAGERDLLAALGDRVDTVVLSARNAADPEAGLADAVGTFVSVVRESGFVNLDLADARTLLRPVDLAGLGVGTAPRDGGAADAVGRAFGSLPAGVETDDASGVLVDLRGGPELSVEDVSDAVTAVRGRVGADAHVIWGGAVDEALADRIRVRLVVAGVDDVRVAPGDPCPRCETTLSAYAFDGRVSLACDDCGFASVSVRHRE